MCNSKQAKLATIEPMYFCPYFLGSALVYIYIYIFFFLTRLPMSPILGPCCSLTKDYVIYFLSSYISTYISLLCSCKLTHRVQASLWYIHRPQSRDIGTLLRARYIPYSYMDPLGKFLKSTSLGSPGLPSQTRARLEASLNEARAPGLTPLLEGDPKARGRYGSFQKSRVVCSIV